MGIGKSGWDALDEETSASRAANSSNSGPKWFIIPPNIVTKRVMFLSEDPHLLHWHSLYEITGRGRDRALCPVKNGYGDKSPLTDAGIRPSLIGHFSIIEMGDVIRGTGKNKGKITLEGFTSDKGITYQFGRKVLSAKAGSAKNPGILHKIRRMHEKRGGLIGTVWDVYRTGDKKANVGDEWDYVETVAPADWKKYLVEWGATEELLELEPIDFTTAFEPPDVEYLSALVRGRKSSPTTTTTPAPSIPTTNIDDEDPDFEESL